MSGNTICRVRAKGEAFSIGYAIGRASAAFLERALRAEQYLALRARWCGSDYLKNLESAARFAYPRYVREIEGIAAGAEQGFEQIFLWNCGADTRFPQDVPAAGTGCTSLLVPAQGDGPAIIAHNEDCPTHYRGACLWVECEPDEGLAWSSFIQPGGLPGDFFLNQAGLVQTAEAITPNDIRLGVPRSIIARALMDAKELDEAIGILKRKDRASGCHYNLGEAKTRRLVSVEAPASGCVVQEADSPRAHTNHLLCAEFDGLKQTIKPNSRDRLAAAERMIGEGALARSPEAVLFDETTPIYKNGEDDSAQTLATVVFELFPDRVGWRIHTAPDKRDALSGTMRVI
ncbi:C45 family peptidase [Mesorhizobium sp. M0243]|uniref:C45 family peptidase n=1 Tax=Mesorhizobium sp. M0243 TaxID=2956925 RepID=UPI00333CAED9